MLDIRLTKLMCIAALTFLYHFNKQFKTENGTNNVEIKNAECIARAAQKHDFKDLPFSS